jgi:eukaryotic-like serine/threonine-protein kinase
LKPMASEDSPAPAAPPLPEVSGYRVQGVLGVGGFGQVYAAELLSTGLAVALKIAPGGHAPAAAMLRHEARMLRLAGTPLTPAVLGEGTTSEGAPFMSMERLRLSTLAELMATTAGPLPLPVLIPRAYAVLTAVGTLHDRGILHCDLKPANIFVQESPSRAQLIDFGVARVAAEGAEGLPEGARPGTAEYMSPEQCESRKDLDVRSDLYALGVILFELFTGQRPFQGNPTELLQAHLAKRPASPSRLVDAAEPFDALILRCLEKERDRRFGGVGALREAFEKAVNVASSQESTRTGVLTASRKPAPAKPAAATTVRKKPMALVLFETAQDASVVQEAATSFGGKVAHLQGATCVFVFEEEASDNPVRRAVLCAQGLCSRGLCSRAIVELSPVTRMQRRANAPPSYTSPLFGKADRYPRATDPEGVLLTPAAADAVPDIATSLLEGRPDLLLLALGVSTGRGEVTRLPDRGLPLVGRDAALRALCDDAAVAWREKRPGVFTVVSEPGHGKTFLAQHLLAQLASNRDVDVLSLRAREPLGGSSRELTRELYRFALGLPTQTPTGGGKSLLLECLPPGVPREAWAPIALDLGWVTTETPEVKALAAAPGVLKNLAVQALSAALRQKAQLCPLLLVVDDAHFADDIALEALERAAAPGELPFWVCVLVRPTFSRPLATWATPAARRQVLTLGSLDGTSAASLTRHLLAPAQNVPADVVDRLVERARGVPLLLVELVRGLKASGVLQKSAKGDYWYVATDVLEKQLDLPLVEWLSERELTAMPQDLRAHARLAALLGTDFVADEFEGVLRTLEKTGHADEFPLDARVGLERLRERELVVQDRARRYRFRTSLVRDAVARSVPEALRKAIHEGAYQFLNTEGERLWERSERLPKLAYHAERAGQTANAAGLHLELAQRAQGRHQYVEAELRYSRALDLLAPSDAEQMLLAHRGRGLMRYRVSRYQDSLVDFERAKEHASALGHTSMTVELLLDESTALDWMLEYHRSKEVLEQAERLAPSDPGALLRARLTMARARTRMRYADYTGACADFATAAEQARPLGDDGYETLVVALLLLAPLSAWLNDLEQAEKTFREVEALCLQRVDRLHLGTVMQNKVLLHMARRNAAGVIEDTKQFLAISEELGMLSGVYRAHYNIAELYYQTGNVAAGLPHLQEAIALNTRLAGGDGSGARPDALLLKARMHLFREELDVARALVTDIVRHQDDVGRQKLDEALLLPPERLLLSMVRLACAPGTSDAEWDELIEQAQTVAVQSDPVEVVELAAMAAARAGRTERAATLLERALKMAEAIPNIMEDRLRSDLARLGPWKP